MGHPLAKPNFPRASTYDPQWLMENCMGPHVLWLAEWLSQDLLLQPDMQVLDLGCGRAISSIFFAREFGVTVWAADLWIKPNENRARIEQAAMSGRVFPIFSEAHDLPFAERSFDAIVSFDAYHYFGTDDLYVGYISRFLKQGGRLGIVVPGVVEELSEIPPSHLTGYWDWEFCSFHSARWWRRHWERTGLMQVDCADWLADGWRLWLEWDEACVQVGPDRIREGAKRELEMLRVDDGRTFGFCKVIGRRR